MEHGIPDDRSGLLTVPGIGDYITSAVLSFHLRGRDVLIDSNIVRLYGRFFGFSFNNETRKKKWLLNLAESITPSRNVREFNYAILDFAMKVCAMEPKCQACELFRRCKFINNEIEQH
jgi:A/G-specific adenine glycosylase